MFDLLSFSSLDPASSHHHPCQPSDACKPTTIWATLQHS